MMNKLKMLSDEENKLLEDYIVAKKVEDVFNFHIKIKEIFSELMEIRNRDIGKEIFKEKDLDVIVLLLTQTDNKLEDIEFDELKYFYELKEKLMENWCWEITSHNVIEFSNSDDRIPVFSDEHPLSDCEVKSHPIDSDDIWGAFIRKLIKDRKRKNQRSDIYD